MVAHLFVPQGHRRERYCACEVTKKKKVLPHHLREKPLLERLFASLQTFPGICDIL